MKLFKASLIFTMSFLILAKEAFADNTDKLKLCENTIESIELQTDIPKGLLLGIGKAEAIRKIKNKDLDEIQNEANEIFNKIITSKKITQTE